MINDQIWLLIIGGVISLVATVVTSLMMFWMEGRRTERIEQLRLRHEDTRTARNWAKDGKRQSLRGFDLTGANLSGKDLEGADLEDAQLEKARLWETKLRGANLIKSNFRKAELNEVDLTDTRMIGATLSGARLTRVNFSRANLSKARLLGVKGAETCVWSEVRISSDTQMSEGLQQIIEQQNKPKEVAALEDKTGASQ